MRGGTGGTEGHGTTNKQTNKNQEKSVIQSGRAFSLSHKNLVLLLTIKRQDL